MAWRGGRCLAALYLETAAGLRQRDGDREQLQRRGRMHDDDDRFPQLLRVLVEDIAQLAVAQLGVCGLLYIYMIFFFNMHVRN